MDNVAKVIGLSGPQGGGKSTLLNGLAARDLFITVDNFKVSRAVQASMGLDSLERVHETASMMVEFQEAVLKHKLEREQELVEYDAHDFVLTERTFADIASYAQLWAWKLADQGKWDLKDAVAFNVDYGARCANAQNVYSGNILLPFMPHIAWQADPHRASQKDVPFITEQLDRFFESKNPKTVPVFRITEGSVQGRIDQAYNWIQTCLAPSENLGTQ